MSSSSRCHFRRWYGGSQITSDIHLFCVPAVWSGRRRMRGKHTGCAGHLGCLIWDHGFQASSCPGSASVAIGPDHVLFGCSRSDFSSRVQKSFSTTCSWTNWNSNYKTYCCVFLKTRIDSHHPSASTDHWRKTIFQVSVSRQFSHQLIMICRCCSYLIWRPAGTAGCELTLSVNLSFCVISSKPSNFSFPAPGNSSATRYYN